MNRLSLLLALTIAAPAAAQTPPVLRLTVDDAVRMALDKNVDLNVERLEPQISDTRVAASVGTFAPTLTSSVQRQNQLQPPINFLFPSATRTDAVTSSAGVAQRIGRFGTSYSVAWNAVHTSSNSFLSSYDPLLQSGLSLGLSQPLLRGLSIDVDRAHLAVNRIDRDIADTRVREDEVQTTADVKRAYWNLVTAIANVAARQSAVDLADELVRVNQAKVDAGQSPPVELLAAQAESTANQEQLIIAKTEVKQREDALRVLIFDPTEAAAWTTDLQLIDAPTLAGAPPSIEAATAAALRDRADLLRARKDTQSAATMTRLREDEKLPDVRFNVSYQANALGGTQLVRTGGFPGVIVGPGTATGFANLVGQLFTYDYPTWNVGLSITYPLGTSTEAANAARAKIEQRQADLRVKSAEAAAIRQIRDAVRAAEMNAQRIQTTRTARQLAEQRLDAERKRFDVGMSTNYLVIQAQRDLAQATQNELAATLAYDLALVEVDALQQAGPRGTSLAAPSTAALQAVGGGNQAVTGAAAPASAPLGGVRIPGF